MAEIRIYKYRIKDRRAAGALRLHAVACNRVWNWCNAYQQDIQRRYQAGAPKRYWPSAFDLAGLCKGVGKELGIHQQTVQVICEQFVRSRNANKGSLRFRSSFGTRRVLGWVPFQKQSRQIEHNSVWYVGKRYRFFGSKRRALPDDAKGGYFVEDSLGRWYVCFHVEIECAPNTDGGAVGIDLGLKSFATLSDGSKIEAPRIYRRYEDRLAIAQRAHNKQRVRRLYAKIKSCRQDFLHKLSTGLAARHALIAVGNVNTKRLTQTRMAKSVLDAGWSTFRAMLKYKSAGYVEMDERFTTQTCAECGSVAGPKGRAGLNEREWICDGCGANHDRDVNSAIVILSRALSAQRLAQESRRAA